MKKTEDFFAFVYIADVFLPTYMPSLHCLILFMTYLPCMSLTEIRSTQRRRVSDLDQ